MNALNDLISSMEVVRDAVLAKETDKACEAATVFLMQFASAFGVQSDFFRRTFQILEQMKGDIENERFEGAEILVSTFLARMRQVENQYRSA